MRRVVALYEAGRFEEGMAELRRLEALAQSSAERADALIAQAIWLAGDERSAETREALAKIRLLGDVPPSIAAEADLLEASLDYNERKYQQALERLNGAVQKYAATLGAPECRDTYEDIQTRRGMLLVELRRYQEARPILEEALHFDGKKIPEFYCQLGACYFFLRQYQLAKENLAKAVAGDLNDEWAVAAHYYLGLAYRYLQAEAWAKQELETAERLAASHPQRARIYTELATTCRRLGLDEGALRYEKLAKEN